VATFVNDTFTGASAELSTHTGETGATWTKHSFGGTNCSIDGSGSLLGNAGGTQNCYYASGTPSSADYSVTVVLNRVGTAGTDLIAVAGRINTAASTWYMASVSGLIFQLFKVVTGTPTLLDTTTLVGTPSNGETFRYTLDMSGTTIIGRLQRISDSAWLNAAGNSWEVAQQDMLSVTDAAIAAAGKAGVAWMQGLLWKFDAITGVDMSADPITGTASPTEAADTSTASGIAGASVAVTSTDLVWSPFNWYSNGGGAMQASNVKASSTYAQSNNVGAYVRLAVSDVATGAVLVNLDTSMLSAVTSGDRPMLGWTVDGGAIQTAQLTTISASHTVTLGTDLGSGAHQIVVYVYSINFGGSHDRWTVPDLTARITGFTIPSGGSTVAVTARDRRALVFGDSIAEGAEINGVGTGIANGGGNIVWGNLLGAYIGAEVGIVGYSGQGYATAANSTPAFSTAHSDYHDSATRLSAGDYVPAPDVVFINHGKNGTTTTGGVEGAVNNVAAAAPDADIYVIPTLDRTNAAAILAATLPSNATFIDLGVLAEYDGSGTGDWYNGVHLNAVGHAAVALLIVDELAATGTVAVTEAADTSTAAGTSGFPVAGKSGAVSTFAPATVVRTFNA
jgi:lysophospholipase L1-like esterase